jgi:hypothetical protein
VAAASLVFACRIQSRSPTPCPLKAGRRTRSLEARLVGRLISCTRLSVLEAWLAMIANLIIFSIKGGRGIGAWKVLGLL